MEKPITPQSLKEIRSEIDAVDRAMLELLGRRFAAIRLIKQWKAQRGEEAISPIRPAREAEILRRLEGLRCDAVPVELMVRLWRAMMAAATAAQAKVTIHFSQDIAGNGGLRDLVREHFMGLALVEHGSLEETIRAAARKPADIGVVQPQSDWIVPVLQEKRLKVIGMLPVLSQVRAAPKLLLLGQAKAEASGDDQTLIAFAAGGETPPAALWSTTSADFRCVSFAGFLDETSEIVKNADRAVILGHCPSPLEARR